MVELINHTSNSIFRKKSHTEGFPKSGHNCLCLCLCTRSVNVVDDCQESGANNLSGTLQDNDPDAAMPEILAEGV